MRWRLHNLVSGLISSTIDFVVVCPTNCLPLLTQLESLLSLEIDDNAGGWYEELHNLVSRLISSTIDCAVVYHTHCLSLLQLQLL